MGGDREPYPPDWRQISERVRLRSRGRCECEGECGRPDCQGRRCEARHGQPHPVTGSKVVLATAHLDHNPWSGDERRLRALCQRCHLHLDRELHARHAAEARAAAYLPAALVAQARALARERNRRLAPAERVHDLWSVLAEALAAYFSEPSADVEPARPAPSSPPQRAA